MQRCKLSALHVFAGGPLHERPLASHFVRVTCQICRGRPSVCTACIAQSQNEFPAKITGCCGAHSWTTKFLPILYVISCYYTRCTARWRKPVSHRPPPLPVAHLQPCFQQNGRLSEAFRGWESARLRNTVFDRRSVVA